jgi:formylglycine-generating enzyme required for sulfatase activity
MAGNVWEWTSDWNEEEQKQIICGGAWSHPPEDAATCADGEPETPINVIGIRCVRDADFDIIQQGTRFVPVN